MRESFFIEEELSKRASRVNKVQTEHIKATFTNKDNKGNRLPERNDTLETNAN